MFWGKKFVGCTSLIRHALDYEISDRYDSTTCLESWICSVNVGHREISLKIQNVPDDESLDMSQFISENCVFILLYSITSESSYNEMEEMCQRVIWEKESSQEEFKVVIIGTKKDLESQRVVSKKQGEDFAIKVGCMFSEINTKNYEEVLDVFGTICEVTSDLKSKPRKKQSPSKEKVQKSGCNVS
eukprot:TRINITY_DN1657_c1_g1_i6.p1 TRINITY_DN1657_c1_g1~~TRINITY_DN1657_c1_g1_i6.p1  ORF type:complete len:186 (-),score=55.47 TRINITY_DN1657_c1_g1_i6:16-573(-)